MSGSDEVLVPNEELSMGTANAVARLGVLIGGRRMVEGKVKMVADVTVKVVGAWRGWVE